MSKNGIKTVEMESNRPYITERGMEPAFVPPVFENTPDEEIHTAMFSGETRWDGNTVIRMVLYPRGGNIEYDDGRSTIHRTFHSKENAVAVFKGTVDTTVEEYKDRNLNFDFDYSPGETEVDFETQ